MGEYARYKGEEIKIGTCESMYYLRADQRHLVEALPNNVDPVKDAGEIRFRFPFPDEDACEPGGDFHGHDFDRKVWLPVVVHCAEARSTYRDPPPAGMHTAIVQQRLVGDRLVLVYECGCGERFRLPTLEDAEPVIDACLDAAGLGDVANMRPWPSKHSYSSATWGLCAGRIKDGYDKPDKIYTTAVGDPVDVEARAFLAKLREIETMRAALTPAVQMRCDALLAADTPPAPGVLKACESIDARGSLSPTVAPKVASAPKYATVKDGTFRRDRLLRLLKAGKLEMVESYHYDDMTGSEHCKDARPCALAPVDERDAEGRIVKFGERKQGVAYLRADEFDGHGRAYARGGLITLHVHSNCNYTFRIKE